MLSLKFYLASSPSTGDRHLSLSTVINTMILTAEQGLQVLIDWLQDNIDCGTSLIFDNDEEQTQSADLLPCVQQALNAVRDLHHLQLLHKSGMQ